MSTISEVYVDSIHPKHFETSYYQNWINKFQLNKLYYQRNRSLVILIYHLRAFLMSQKQLLIKWKL